MSKGMDDMMDWMIYKACHVDPLVDIADAYYAMVGYVPINKINIDGKDHKVVAIKQVTIEHIKINQRTYDALNDAHHAEVIGVKDITTYNGVPIIIDDSLPDNVYKFD